jgi:hypothetical protein
MADEAIALAMSTNQFDPEQVGLVDLYNSTGGPSWYVKLAG